MKKLVVLGGGISGYGSAILARRKGFDVFLSDSGRIDLIEHTERCRSVKQYRKINCQRYHRLFTARKKRQALYYLSRRCGIYLNIGVQHIVRV